MGSDRILVVEDDAAVAADLQSTLQDLGFQVPLVLGSAERALEAAREANVDLALLDIRLAGDVDGTELGKILGQELGIPAVYLTAFSDDTTLASIRHAGSSGYLLKPFRREELRAVVTLALDAHRARQRLKSVQERYRALFEHSLAGVLRKSINGTILECNDAFAQILGYDSPSELQGESAEILYLSPEERKEFLDELGEHGTVRNMELRMRRKGDQPVWVLDNSTIVREPTGGDVILSTILDISERKSLEISLKEMAYHDPLTQLPNRRHLNEVAPQILALAERREIRVGLFFLDLVGFKKINDTHGHGMGDRVLNEVGRRLEGEIRAADTVARMGGDEFAVLLAGVDDMQGVERAARRLIRLLEAPLTVDGVEVAVSGRFGVAVYPDHAQDFDELLTRADLAVAEAKTLGGSAVVVASSS